MPHILDNESETREWLLSEAAALCEAANTAKYVIQEAQVQLSEAGERIKFLEKELSLRDLLISSLRQELAIWNVEG